MQGVNFKIVPDFIQQEILCASVSVFSASLSILVFLVWTKNHDIAYCNEYFDDEKTLIVKLLTKQTQGFSFTFSGNNNNSNPHPKFVF